MRTEDITGACKTAPYRTSAAAWLAIWSLLGAQQQTTKAAPVIDLKRTPLADFNAIAIDGNGPASCWGKGVGMSTAAEKWI